MESNIDTKRLRKFEREIWKYYLANKRNLPWRSTTNPYHILVSEVMLQQTQVSRVILKYQEFLKKFPTIQSLAKASKADVLTIWQGLGYNRRALFLKKTCETLFGQNPKKPHFPITHEELLKLPGVGQSTAGALLAFAFNKPTPFIETNIRAVYLYFFFKDSSSVSDIHIYELLQKTLTLKKQKENPREWYYALYDYGTMLKAKLGRKKTELHKQSKHYNKQSTFKGSNREIRGAILRLFTKHEKLSENQIVGALRKELSNRTDDDIEKKVGTNLKSLIQEGFIQIDEQTKVQKRGANIPPPIYSLSVV